MNNSFSSVDQLSICCSNKITDDALKYVNILNISNCSILTHNAIKHLTKLQHLYMVYCCNIEETIFENLKDLHVLEISGCNQITDNGSINLKNLNVLIMHQCENITYNGLAFLNLFC